MSKVITPDWSAPAHVKVLSTTRAGGVSKPPYDSMNLGLHVGDNPDDVHTNRRLLVEQHQLPGAPLWLQQVHGTRVINAKDADVASPADAAVTDRREDVLAIMTADCLPVVLTDSTGENLAVVHAGWRGLAQGVLQNAVAALPAHARLHAWLGPAIGPRAFEVGEEVRATFASRRDGFDRAFIPGPAPGKYLADLYELARIELRALGDISCSGGNWCTWSDAVRFHSHRRDGAGSGRMVTLAWLDNC